ncbi:MAG: hypothetical protein B7Y61_14585 [Rhizobiales bacterium 35-66-30]|jgi:hypothetical protein|nr:MAG: hypothetical protein B7Y61_14585 [Rhizobiales bacterium 35-66-30]
MAPLPFIGHGWRRKESGHRFDPGFGRGSKTRRNGSNEAGRYANGRRGSVGGVARFEKGCTNAASAEDE